MTTVFDAVGADKPLFLCQDWRILRHVVEGIRRTEYSYLLFSRRKRTTETDRRAYDRFNAQIPIQITPVLFDGTKVERLDASISTLPAVTKDLTLRGVGFSHNQLLVGDHVIIHCDLMNPGCVALLLSLRWTNVRHGGLFMSGGRFEGLVSTQATLPVFE